MFKPGSSSFATKLAHTSKIPGFGNQDLRLLQDVITHEKGVVMSLQKLSADLLKSNESLKSWGQGEGEDLGDVLLQANKMLAHVGEALDQLANHENAIRTHLKDVRTREEQLDELRRRRKTIGAKAEDAEKKLSKMSGEHKNLQLQTDLLAQLRDQMRSLDSQILIDEASVSDFKRLATRQFMAIKFGGLLEFAEKVTIVGELGKVLIEEIPLDATQPGHPRIYYQGFESTAKIETEVARCVAQVTFMPPGDVDAIAHAPDTSTGSAMPMTDDHARYGTDHSEYMPSPVAHSVPPSEFGEDPSRYADRPAAVSQPGRGPSGPSGGAGQFATFPATARRPNRDVSFATSMQEALDMNPTLSNIHISAPQPSYAAPSGPPPQMGQAIVADQQPNPWNPQRNSWADRPDEERAMDAALARDIGRELDEVTTIPMQPPETTFRPTSDSNPTSPTHATFVGTQPPTSMQATQVPTMHTIAPSASTTPAAPSMYGTPAQSFASPPNLGARTISAAAFKRRPTPGASSVPGSPVVGSAQPGPADFMEAGEQADLSRNETLPAYRPIDHDSAEDAYGGTAEHAQYALHAQEPHVGMGVGSPSDVDYGRLGPTRVNNQDGGYQGGHYGTNLEH